MGGRKPTKDLNISPEEEERRRIRRERNKLAAARCRKRRVDHTNALIEVSFLQFPSIRVYVNIFIISGNRIVRTQETRAADGAARVA